MESNCCIFLLLDHYRAESKPKAKVNIDFEQDYYQVGKDTGETLKQIYGVEYFLLFPDNKHKQRWDLWVSFLVILSCILTPWRIAFIDSDDSFWWILLDTLIDTFFLVDIVLNFFTVYTNSYEDYETDRRKIAFKYLRGWFIFDLIAILPIQYFFTAGSGINDLARLARLPRLYRLIKVFRLIRVFRLVKQSGRIKKYAGEMLQIGMIIERVLTFSFILFITTHVFACMWYFLAKWNEFEPDTWVAITNYQDESNWTIYVYCFYFIITIITTVGYGDMPVTTSGEKILAMLVMIVGVITFSFAIGSLTSALSNLDNRAAKLKAKSFELNSIRKKYKVKSDLYNKLFKALKFEIEQDENIEEFMTTLPTVLRTELSLCINNEIINIIPYFKEKDQSF